MKKFIKNLPIVLWGAAFFFGSIALNYYGNILALIIFIVLMLLLLLVGAIYLI
jgi:hypothetical protein